MPETIFIAGSEPGSGKTVVTIGLARYLSNVVNRVGYMKPVGTKPSHEFESIDEDVMIIREILQDNSSLSDTCPLRFDEIRDAILDQRKEDILKRVVTAHQKVSADKDVVIVEGTDHEHLVGRDFDLNADIAKAIGCKVLLVAKGGDKTEEDILADIENVRDACRAKDVNLIGVVVNNVSKERYKTVNRGLRERLKLRDLPLLGVLPANDVLPHPRVGDIRKHFDHELEVLYGGDFLSNMVFNYLVGSMQPSNALEYFRSGSLVVTAGDRDDLILAAVATYMAPDFPPLAGLILTGGLKPSRALSDLIENIEGLNFPILSSKLDTYTTISMIKNLDVHIEPQDKEKIDVACELVRDYVNVEEAIELSHVTITHRRTPEDFTQAILREAEALNKHIVFPEGSEPRVISAAHEISTRKIARVTLLGTEEEIRMRARRSRIDLASVQIIDPLKAANLDRYAEILHEKRKHKGMTLDQAHDTIQENIYYGTVMVENGDADGLVSGARHSTANTIRPALQIIKTAPDVNTVSSVFFMLKGSKIFLYGDCAIVEAPDQEQLCDIALSSVKTARAFNVAPQVAMLSFSTGDSGSGPAVEKVRAATKKALSIMPDLNLEGPMQYDTAFDPEVAKVKAPDSKVAGRANVFIFPDLNSGNIAYKAVQREAGAIAIGPILQGLAKPVNDLSRGCNIQDIIYVSAITAIQASILA